MSGPCKLDPALQPSKTIYINKQASATSGNIKVLKNIRIFCTTNMWKTAVRLSHRICYVLNQFYFLAVILRLWRNFLVKTFLYRKIPLYISNSMKRSGNTEKRDIYTECYSCYKGKGRTWIVKKLMSKSQITPLYTSENSYYINKCFLQLTFKFIFWTLFELDFIKSQYSN